MHRRNQSGKAIFARFHAKLSIVCDCKSHLITAILATKGPSPDSPTLAPLMKNQAPHIKINTLLADAGYDSEANHCFLRNDCHIQSVIIRPLIGRHTTAPPKGFFRIKMRVHFKKYGSKIYGQRWQVESTFSMMKRNLGSALSARSTHARHRELYLRTLCHNIAIIAQ